MGHGPHRVEDSRFFDRCPRCLSFSRMIGPVTSNLYSFVFRVSVSSRPWQLHVLAGSSPSVSQYPKKTKERISFHFQRTLLFWSSYFLSFSTKFDFCLFSSSVFSSFSLEFSSFLDQKVDFLFFSGPFRWCRDLIPIHSVEFGFPFS